MRKNRATLACKVAHFGKPCISRVVSLTDCRMGTSGKHSDWIATVTSWVILARVLVIISLKSSAISSICGVACGGNVNQIECALTPPSPSPSPSVALALPYITF